MPRESAFTYSLINTMVQATVLIIQLPNAVALMNTMTAIQAAPCSALFRDIVVVFRLGFR
jgi:hypothetical protein